MTTTTLQALLDKYGESHQNKTNIIIHKICVPLITITIVNLVSLIDSTAILGDFFNLAHVLCALALLFYFSLHMRVALVMSFIALLILWQAHIVNNAFHKKELFIFWSVVFVISWIMQFIGHAIEKKKPSFLEDMKFLLIGPLWVFLKRKF